MKRNLIILGVLIGFLSGGVAFGWEFFSVINNPLNIPWIYNPVSGYYEPKSEEQIQKEIEEEKINKMDFYSDNSFQKFLDDNHLLAGSYEASDIVKINSDFTSNNSSDFMLRKEATEMFEGMAWEFSKAFNFKAKLTINSARRSQAYQRKLSASCSTSRCAKPGTSEHEAGLALDLGVNGVSIKAGDGKYYQRFVDNAHKYGFHNSYQRGMEVDGKMVEPRHWRYMGVELATILHDNNQTFAEYFYQNIEPKV